jgi:hypothetical protein
MPWKIKHNGMRYQVVKEEDGKVVGSHMSKAKAVKHLRALYANAK